MEHKKSIIHYMEAQFLFISSVNEGNVIYTINTIKDLYYNGATKLNLFISSPGGDIEFGFRLFDFLINLPIPVKTYGFGQVSSIAVPIFLSGKDRVCTKNCTFFLHEGNYSNSFQQTSFNIVSETAKLLNHNLEKSIDIISKRTGKPLTQITKLIKESSILNSSQAKNLNIIQGTIDSLPLLKNTQLPAQNLGVLPNQPQTPQPTLTPTTPTTNSFMGITK